VPRPLLPSTTAALSLSRCSGRLRDRPSFPTRRSSDLAHDINQGERQIGKDQFRWFLGMMDRHYRERLEDVVVMAGQGGGRGAARSEEHTSELQSREKLVCRLLLEKKKNARHERAANAA